MVFHNLHNFIIPWLHYFWILKNLKQKFNKGKLKKMKISYDYTVISLKFVYFYWKKFESSWQVILFQIVRKKKKE